jgi:hypothetical protein
MTKLLAAVDPAVQELFGGITPPDAMNVGGSDPVQGFGNFIGFGIRMFIVVAGFFMLLYLLWGAYDWIASGGEKEKIAKAQSKITNALIGIVLVFAVLTIFNLLAGNILGIVVPNGNGGFTIQLPTLDGGPTPYTGPNP